ncbi:MAG: hypothetical protein KGJ98_11720 [Chloroflexota bacterium]|nr:hypothetical protein [Chloroflexota bacterium]
MRRSPVRIWPSAQEKRDFSRATPDLDDSSDDIQREAGRELFVLAEESYRPLDAFEREGPGVSVVGVYSSIESAKRALRVVLGPELFGDLDWETEGGLCLGSSDGPYDMARIYAITARKIDET